MKSSEVPDERLLLELLNTRSFVDGVERDELADQSSGGAWMSGHGIAAGKVELTAARQARDTLAEVTLGRQPVPTLGVLLAGVLSRPVATAAGVQWELEIPAGREIGVRAVLAWDALRSSAPGRLRACENPECVRFLIDRSRANTARWCSMAVCGNRMKARRHYERSRTAAD